MFTLPLAPSPVPAVSTARRSLRSRSRSRARSAFTLIELLLVLVILAILAGIVVTKFTGRVEQARQVKAKTDLSNLNSALAIFEQDNGRFPSTQEGLAALASNPGNLSGWKHAYIDKVPNDPWDKPYIYRYPGNSGKEYDLLSGGPDGQEGGGDDID